MNMKSLNMGLLVQDNITSALLCVRGVTLLDLDKQN